MSYYVDYIAGQIVTGYRCSHCAYDTNNQHIIWSASIPLVNTVSPSAIHTVQTGREQVEYTASIADGTSHRFV